MRSVKRSLAAVWGLLLKPDEGSLIVFEKLTRCRNAGEAEAGLSNLTC
jgi:hypothetical protein